MKRLLYLSLISLTIIGCGTSSTSTSSTAPKIEDANPSDYAATITQEELKTMLYTYASDEFEGRDTGEKGQKLAVEYLKKQYLEMGIASPLGGDDYFQEVPLERQKVGDATITVNGKTFKSFEHLVVLTASQSENLNLTNLVYVGYGIDTDNYSDYKSVNVKGKIVLAKSGEPKDADGNYVTSGTTEETKWSSGRASLSSKRDAAIENGAKGLIYLDEAMFSRYAPFYQRRAESNVPGRISLKSNSPDLLRIMVNEELAKAIFPNVLTEDKPKIITTQTTINIVNASEKVSSENVVAYIKGSEKPDEIIVISAHLDHVGIENGEVYNGADDDGSGTVAIVEIAEAFQEAVKNGFSPKRSVVFLHVTGEERGLLGSRHYTDNDPIFPLENTVANLNIDMIGRTDPERKEGDRNYIYLIGSDKLSTDLHNISEEVNATYCNVDLDYTYNDENDPNRFYYRSDHYNFAKNNIPVIFYFNGTHADYHKASDTPDKIEYDLMTNRAKLVFHTAWELANRAERIVVDKATK
ncbi:M28 family peptidase [Winogradskyella sp. DF17]|uniref:M28 family peptidase n=1 Tax=Winogradskyella pelagia TaxID=2819984 RepID=A0ABS3T199_9FLAO|nr:M28 family peptidase [Winogradskyella sp. DF17]MBO3116526.1 M28 family peptidase [Winogradskyella sp. DF17]